MPILFAPSFMGHSDVAYKVEHFQGCVASHLRQERGWISTLKKRWLQAYAGIL